MISLLLHSTLLLGPGNHWDPQMDLALAAKPYRHLSHNCAGYIDGRGRVVNRGLSPQAFVSVVLHRMKHGSGWLQAYRPELHNWSPTRMARHFDLGPARQLPATALLPGLQTRGRGTAARQLELPPGLYLFAAEAGGRRHLGFVELTRSGALIQTHYSGLARYGRLARGDLRSWYAASPFRGHPLQLHLVRTR